MKSKESYFSISLPMLKENLRRFWALSAVGFLFYFFSGIFPVLMSYDDLSPMATYIEDMLDNQNPIFVMTNLLIPVITAIVIFAYIHQRASVTSLHAMPFTRAKLFNTYFVSGVILQLIPILLNGIILLAIAKPAYSEAMLENSEDNPLHNLFARGDICEWIVQTIIILMFIYAISVFAGMVCGNCGMHAAAAFGFNFLVPAIYVTFIAYCSLMLYGYDMGSAFDETVFIFSPFLQSFVSNGMFSAAATLGYIIAIICITVVSAILYNKRKFEKTGESLVFNFLIPIISYLIAYFGMSLLGFYFRELAEIDKTNLYMFVGFAAGAFIFFIIGRMIILKTPKVFTKSTFKNMAIYAVVAIVFLTSLMCDLTGFETRVPDYRDTKLAAVSLFFGENDWDRYASHYFKTDDKDLDAIGNDRTAIFHEEENIKNVSELHKEIIENKENNLNIDEEELTSSVQVFYEMKGGSNLVRNYSVPYQLYRKSDATAKLFESKEFKDHFSLYNFDGKFTTVSIDATQYTEGICLEIAKIGENNDKEKVDDIIACLEKDFQKRTYEEEMTGRPYCIVDIGYIGKAKDEYGRGVVEYFSIPVLQSDKNTIKFLRENGYSAKLELTPDMIEYVEVTRMIAGNTDGEAKIKNAEEIKMILETCKENHYTTLNNYQLELYLNEKGKALVDSINSTAIDEEISKDDSSDLEILPDNSSDLYVISGLYYRYDEVPANIKNLFS